MPPANDFNRAMKSKESRPIYVLVSTDAFLLAESITTLRGKVLTAAPSFNRDEFQAGTDSIDRVIQAAATLPMMAPKRWVHLSNLHKLKAKEHGPLIKYLQDPSDMSVLCLSGEKVDKRTKLGQTLSKGGHIFELKAPRLNAMAGWLRQRAEHHKYMLNNDAAQLLVDLIGTDLGSLDAALHKLATYAGDNQPITSEHVESNVSATRVHSVFELTDAIGDRDLPRAAMLLRNALDGGENGLMILAMVARQLRLLLRTKKLKSAGVARQNFARELRIPPFMVDALTGQSERYGERELCLGIESASKADILIKSSRLSPGVILDQLLVQLLTTDEALA